MARHCRRSARPLATPLALCYRPRMGGEPQAGDLSGRTVGNWRLIKRLGEGAFGAVYEVENATISASRAEHENIVQIFDGGITPDGICYVVMELLRGLTLSDLIRRGPLDTARA